MGKKLNKILPFFGLSSICFAVLYFLGNKITLTRTIPDESRVPLSDRLCHTVEDCSWVHFDCGGCECPHPVNKQVYEQKYRLMIEERCQRDGENRGWWIVCDMDCPFESACDDGYCVKTERGNLWRIMSKTITLKIR
ncbi:hypothetical protein JXA63_03520 [Candidatus Woesebacteria bacterium]|nr:hypothetical protein [Candidatus Woesebacteria bacterium]